MYEVVRNEQLGRVVAFWSPIHRQGATSTTAAMVAAYMARESNLDGKILVISNELYGSLTAGDYLTEESLQDGLTEIVALAKCGNLNTHEDIYNNTFSGVENIDIVPNSKKNNSLTDFDIGSSIGVILDKAKQGYKYIFVDCVAGKHNLSSRSILGYADVRVVCMPQDRYILDCWIRKLANVYLQDYEEKQTIIVLEQYYDYRHMGYNRLCKELKTPDLAYIDLNTTIHMAVSERKIVDIMKNLKKTDADLDSQLKTIVNKIEDGIQTVINKEIEKSVKEEGEMRTQTQEYIDNIEILDVDYDDEYDSSSEQSSNAVDDNSTYKTDDSSSERELESSVDNGIDSLSEQIPSANISNKQSDNDESSSEMISNGNESADYDADIIYSTDKDNI